MNDFIVKFLLAIGFIIVAPFVGGMLSGYDRVLTARMQGRKGPSPLQPFYDVSKLFNKEQIVVNGLQGVLLLTHLFLVIICGVMLYMGYNLLMIVFISATAAMFLVLAAGCTDSPYSSLGTQRELLQMMCAEPIELLVAVGFYLARGSFQAADIISGSKVLVLILPGVFLAFILILTIKFRKSPFDLSTSHHAHQELVKGLTTEMSGNYMAVLEIAEWYEEVFLLSIVAMFFMTANGAWGIIVGCIAALAVWFLEILIDNTSARVSWQTTFKISWIATLVLAGLNILVLCVVN